MDIIAKPIKDGTVLQAVSRGLVIASIFIQNGDLDDVYPRFIVHSQKECTAEVKMSLEYASKAYIHPIFHPRLKEAIHVEYDEAI